MSTMRLLLLPSLVFFVLAGCASSEPVAKPQNKELSLRELSNVLGCDSTEVPFCIDVDCALTEYACVDRARALGTLQPGYRNQ